MILLTVEDIARYEQVSERAIRKRIANNYYEDVRKNGRGYELPVECLSEAASKRFWAEYETDETIYQGEVDKSLVNAGQVDQGVERLNLIKKAMAVPRGVRRNDWVEQCAADAKVSGRTLSRWISRYKQTGKVSGRKRRSDQGVLRAWDKEARDTLISKYMSNRNKSARQIYRETCDLAARAGWRVGSERSANDILTSLEDYAHVYRKYGMRGIENEIAPPILRDYTDLNANEIWVGDQHTFNFFVFDEVTGREFRMQCYMWQDLRTRGIAGISITEQYDSYSIGLALRDGIMKKVDRLIYGKPERVYNDWGKPEKSKYLNGLQASGIVYKNVDKEFDEYLNRYLLNEGVYGELDIKSQYAIVRNSKAKLIERTFGSLETMLRDKGLPGYAGMRVGTLTDADREDLKRQRIRGELMPAKKFVRLVRDVVEEYNQRPHRGYGMQGLSPNEVFEQQLHAGYTPITITHEQADILFMKPARRKVSKMGVSIDSKFYINHEINWRLVGKWVDVRYVPYADRVLIFRNGEFICEAELYKRGSMKDDRLTAELIARKKSVKKDIKREIQDMIGHREDYDGAAPGGKVAKTRFDDAAKKVTKKKKQQKKQKNIPASELYKVLADTNRSILQEKN